MKKKIALACVIALMLSSLVLASCGGSSGITQADYDIINTKLQTALANLTAATTEKENAQGDLQSAQADITALEAEIAKLKALYENTGATAKEIVTKLVKDYYDSHYYLKNIYDCNNMASDLWDMLKKLNISSVIVIGSKDVVVTDILNTDHAWVMADLGNGEKLALDATGGQAITKEQNPLYYQGWTFSDPAALKANDDLKVAYNTRVNFINNLVAEINDAMNLYNNSSNQAEADKYLLLYNTLKDIKAAEEVAINQLKTQIDGLSTPL